MPIIYQSGYLTIKGYDPAKDFYTLNFPNAEVKYGWLNFITPYYTPLSESTAPFYIGKFWDELRAGDVDAFMERLHAFFEGIPYELNSKTERHYQVIFYIVFKLLGQYVDAEVRSARGRADAVVKTTDYIYVFEFKLDGSVDEALRQIDEKRLSDSLHRRQSPTGQSRCLLRQRKTQYRRMESHFLLTIPHYPFRFYPIMSKNKRSLT